MNKKHIRKYSLFVFFLLITTFSKAENITGYVRSETGYGVPFASIFLQKKNIGLITNIYGQYRLPIDILLEVYDTLVFSSVGYVTKRIPVSLFAEKALAGHTTIVLTINSISLPETVIVASPHGPRNYGFFHLRSARFFIPSVPGGRIMVFVENTDNMPKIIQTINIRQRSGVADRVEKIRVFFYQKNETGFQNINVANEGIFITDLSQENIRHDVSKHRIPFPAEGIFVGIEWIGPENVIQDRSRAIDLLGVSATNRIRGYRSWMFAKGRGEWVLFPPEILKQMLNDEFSGRIGQGMVRRLFRNINFQIGLTAY